MAPPNPLRLAALDRRASRRQQAGYYEVLGRATVYKDGMMQPPVVPGGNPRGLTAQTMVHASPSFAV